MVPSADPDKRSVFGHRQDANWVHSGMNWAPVVRVASASGRQLGTLAVVDELRVEWRRFGSVYRQYSMQSPVHDALFTRFAHAKNTSEVWVVIVCKDRLIHSYATESGEHYVTGITFLPSTVLACPEQGIMFTSMTPAHPTQSLHLLQGPEELLGSVVPSSLCAPLDKSDRVLHFDEHHAVVWDSHKLLVRLYTVRLIHHRLSRPGSGPASAGSGSGSGLVSAGSGSGSAGSAVSTSISTGSLSMESINKVAVIQLVREWRQSTVGHIFSQSLSPPLGRKLHMIVVHDPQDDHLFAFCEGELIRHSDVTFARPVAGLHGIPAVMVAFKDSVTFAFLLFPQTPMLSLPIPAEFRGLNITGLDSDPRANWVAIDFGSHGSCNLQLAADLDPLVQTCVSIVQEISGPLESAFWLVGLLTQRLYANDYWEAFEATMENLAPEMDVSQISHIITCLHLLREEYTLASGSADTVRLLDKLIRRFVVSWGPAWTDYYPNSASDLSFEIPRSMDAPPNIYAALNGTIQGLDGLRDYPNVVTGSSLYPKSSTLMSFFQMLSVETPLAELRQYVEDHFTGSKLLDLAPSARVCVIEVAESLDLKLFRPNKESGSSDKSGLMHSVTSNGALRVVNNWRQEPDSRSLTDALFSEDRRFHEAERLLQTKDPQQCVFGAFFDSEKLSDHELAQHQAQWGRALADRALASAFGRAALDLGRRNPVAWEQLEIPTIDFSGECSTTGLSIPPSFKSLDQASAYAAWGVFAHGAALGLSISPKSPGVDSLWVITSAKLKAASDVLYAGLVFGMGLSGHLKGLEEWQFYESLVSSDSRGTVAALLGVAASERGSRDTKLTKVFSVHVRALLPEAARAEPLVGPEEERAAILSLGLLYQGQGVRHLSEVFSRELLNAQRPDIKSLSVTQREPSEQDDMEQARGSNLPACDDEDYNLALGIALGLINSGKANLSQLLPLVTRVRDRTSFSPGAANGALCALLLSYVGSNAKLVATQVQLPSARRAAVYSTPSTLFAKALTRHLIMWDEIEPRLEWVLAQVPSVLCPEAGESSEIEGLWYIHALGGVLAAVAFRHTSSNDSRVISIILGLIKSTFYPKYAKLLRVLNIPGEGNEHRVNYDAVQSAKNVAQVIGALCLAVAATAAGSGNLEVLQVLRVAYQISPQVQASEHPQGSYVEGVGIDQVVISEAIGWLFMGGGQWSFLADPVSVGLLSCVSLLPLLGGPGIQEDHWHHLRFLWVLLAEHRCLHALHNPTDRVQIELVAKSGQVLHTQMPCLLPPLSEIKEVRVTDDRYRPFITTNLSCLDSGLPIVRHAGPGNTLDAYLTNLTGSEPAAASKAREIVSAALEALQYTAEHMQTRSELEALRLVLAFGENWSALERDRVLTLGDCERIKLSMWRRTNQPVAQ